MPTGVKRASASLPPAGEPDGHLCARIGQPGKHGLAIAHHQDLQVAGAEVPGGGLLDGLAVDGPDLGHVGAPVVERQVEVDQLAEGGQGLDAGGKTGGQGQDAAVLLAATSSSSGSPPATPRISRRISWMDSMVTLVRTEAVARKVLPSRVYWKPPPAPYA
jgi:hypothetical protein